MSGDSDADHKLKEQLRAPHARVLRRLPLSQMSSALVRDAGGEIYLAVYQGRNTLLYAVLEDGTVDRAARGTIQFPDQRKVYEVIDPRSIGFSTVVWSDRSCPS